MPYNLKKRRIFKMVREVNYMIIDETDEFLLIQDIGQWNIYKTVTNAAEIVVKELATQLNGRRLEYIDSDGRRDQLLVKDGAFAGFAPIPKIEEE